MIEAQALEDFAREAQAFCSWATGDDGSEIDISQALVRISNLYVAGLALPSPFGAELSTQDQNVELPTSALERVAKRAAALPLQVYWEVFAPIEDPPDEPVVGSIDDDLGDIYRDVARGLSLYHAGRKQDAHWEWAFNFRVHWGKHATGAITAIHAYVTHRGSGGKYSAIPP